MTGEHVAVQFVSILWGDILCGGEIFFPFFPDSSIETLSKHITFNFLSLCKLIL